MQKGLADPYRELERQFGYTVQCHGYEDVYRACNVEPHEGRVRGKDAERAWMVMRKFLGEDSRVELLRRDHPKGTYETANRLADMLSGKADYKN
jgi:hypothetical protein